MTADEEKRQQQLELKLFFNKQRILRWLNWYRGEQDHHPDPQINQQEYFHNLARK